MNYLRFLYTVQSTLAATSQFSTIISPPADLIEKSYAFVGKRTCLAAERILLCDTWWSAEHEAAFQHCKRDLRNQVALIHVIKHKRLRDYLDTTDFFEASVATRTSMNEPSLSCSDKLHEPLLCRLEILVARCHIGLSLKKKHMQSCQQLTMCIIFFPPDEDLTSTLTATVGSSCFAERRLLYTSI